MAARNRSTPDRPGRGVIVAGLATMFLLGAVAGELRSGPSAIAPSGSATIANPGAVDPVSGAGPSESRWGVPIGFSRTEEGATAAAVGYVLSGSAFLGLAPSQVPAAVSLMSSEASAAARLREAETKLAQLRQVLSGGRGPTRYLQAVLAVRIDAFEPDRARVSVWSVGVLSRDGAASPQAGWTTSTFHLVWERGDWKIWGEEIAPGPTPDLNAADPPASSTDLDARLEGFAVWGTGR